MAIEGAIFDCDGTLLDSMPMWTMQCVGLLERYGVKDAKRVFADHESLNMDEKCRWYHENLGIGQSSEALLEELWSAVEEAYGTQVRPFEGCIAFLEELCAQGIPCAILSSTPTELLRMALDAHGMLGFFQDLIFVGDVGTSKESSECYLATARRLGTSVDRTWVFEDAPFGVRSAARAGFPVVGIMNEHDGRDEEFVLRWATILARTYGELSLGKLNSLEPRVTRALVVAGSPEPSSPALVTDLARSADLVVAADKGTDALLKAGVTPSLFCGDEDSASQDALRWLREKNVELERHPVEKDDTDLGLAIVLARKRAEERGSALRLTVTCASGGREDHMLGVFGLLARSADVWAQLVEDDFVCRVLSPLGRNEWRIDDRVGDTLSVVALAPDTRVSESGMRWNLEECVLDVLDDVGISNRIVSSEACVCCRCGVALVFLHVGNCLDGADASL